MNAQPATPEALAEFVKQAAPVVTTQLSDHVRGWHDKHPRAGCPSCLFSSRLEGNQ